MLVLRLSTGLGQNTNQATRHNNYGLFKCNKISMVSSYVVVTINRSEQEFQQS